MNFDLYKNQLIDFLQKKGIKEAKRGLIHCFNPQHNDKNPSCELFDDHFICYSCGIHGDIYDACQILDGYTSKVEQFQEVEKTLNGFSQPVNLKKNALPEKAEFIPDESAIKLVLDYLSKNPARKDKVTQFLNKRAFLSTNGKVKSYPQPILENLVKFFFYWPGFTAAAAEVPPLRLVAAGIPGRNPRTGVSSWDEPGVIVKLGVGFKLHYYQEGKEHCEKRGSRACCSFPMPQGFDPHSKQIILVEGELDAISCRAAGIENVFSAGGVYGITKPKVQKYLLDIAEVVIFFDNDLAGRKASGLEPISKDDKKQTSIPETLLKAGYKGSIKIASLPADCGFKDQDAAIIANKIDLIKSAINNAIDYKAPKNKPDIHGSLWLQYDTISIKRLKALLKKVEFNALDEEDQQFFISAAVKSCRNSQTETELLKWGASQEMIKAKNDVTPYYLLEACDKYGVSAYLKRELEKALVPGAEILRNIQAQKTIVEIDYDKMDDSTNFLQFLTTEGVRSAAQTVAEVLDGHLIYVENEKKSYFFDGNVWIREPDVAGTAYAILCSLLRHYLQNHADKKTIIYELLKKIEGRRFRVELVQDLNGLKPEVFRENVPFDGPQICGTLTLLDGVIDFSGKEIEYRKSRPEEYRREMLPYKSDEIKNGTTPEKFLAFMNGNFKEEKTLNTLVYYLSLIPSRNTSYKYGGIFIGKHNTGKSTTLNIVEAIFSGCCERIKSDVLVSIGSKRVSGNEATPEIAKIEGKCAAFVQETARNAALNTSFWKELTGGDTLTARNLYREPHDFLPTAQIIIASNYSPNFDAHDEAAISRMIVIPFNIQHSKHDKDAKTSTEFISYLRPEFPSIVKYFIEKYIDLHINLRGNIPLSPECENYKGRYVEEQKTDLDKFVETCITFDLSNPKNIFEKVQTVYEKYLEYYGISEDSKEALTRNKFTRFLKRDYKEIDYGQKKINGYPELVFYNVKLTDWKKTDTEPQPETTMPLPLEAPTQPDFSAPTDDPFESSDNDSEDLPDIF